jgi:diphthamide synthase subunit DPH2
MGKPSEPIISKVIAGRLIAVVVKYLGRSIKGEMIDIIKRIITGSEAEAKKIWVNEIFPKLLENLDI